MTDTPAAQAPLDPKEQPILDRILGVWDSLSLLKQDRSTYIKSHDVLKLHEELVEQVHLLNVTREEQDKPLEQNRGTTPQGKQPGLGYSMTSTIKRLLDHLKEAAFYSPKDLESISQKLDSMEEIIKLGEATHSPHLLKLLENPLNRCRHLLAELQSSLADLSPQLIPVYERLVSILRSISAANTRQKFPTAEVQSFQDQLREVQATMVDGKFLADDGTAPAGQHVATELLYRCLKWSELVLARQGKIDDRFKPTYDKLCEVLNQLEKLSITQAWSLRETDLYDYQRRLDKIDESRINGNFEDQSGVKADLHTQRV
ncbi:MAG: hypothetical protein Q9197_001572 [Variospora fuerteventurae]